MHLMSHHLIFYNDPNTLPLTIQNCPTSCELFLNFGNNEPINLYIYLNE
jgi:hypothetical protein